MKLTELPRARNRSLTIFNSGGYQVWPSGVWRVMPEV